MLKSLGRLRDELRIAEVRKRGSWEAGTSGSKSGPLFAVSLEPADAIPRMESR